jgi:ubiquitin-activating enzyme E1
VVLPNQTPVERMTSIMNSLTKPSRSMNSLTFEKDDYSNDHVQFVTAASNLRALAYGIPLADILETRRIAGNIVPAMITTTAIVSSLSCLEFLKLVSKAPVNRHRNAFVNLALPFFAFTVPALAEPKVGLHGKTFTFWDRIILNERKKNANEGGITLRSVLKRIKKKVTNDPTHIKITSVSAGPFLLYADFLHDDDEEILKKSIWRLMEETNIDGSEFETDKESSVIDPLLTRNPTFVDLSVMVQDLESGEEMEIPCVRVQKWKE